MKGVLWSTYICRADGKVDFCYQGTSYADALMSWPSFIGEGDRFFMKKSGQKRKQIERYILQERKE